MVNLLPLAHRFNNLPVNGRGIRGSARRFFPSSDGAKPKKVLTTTSAKAPPLMHSFMQPSRSAIRSTCVPRPGMVAFQRQRTTPWSFVTESGFVEGQTTVAKPGRWFVLRTEIASGCNQPETDNASSTLVLVADRLAICTRTITARCSLIMRVSVSTARPAQLVFRRKARYGYQRHSVAGYSFPAIVSVIGG